MSEMAVWTSACDLSYVGLTADQHASYSFPSKVQTTMFMGKPLLSCVTGDVNRLVESEGIGFVADPGDPKSMTQALSLTVELGRNGLDDMGRRARQVYDATFARDVAITRVAQALVGGPLVSEDVTIREVGAGDIDEIVRVHMRAFPDFFLTFLGPRFLRLLYGDIARDPRGQVLIAHDGRSIVGLLAGLDNEQQYFSDLRARSQRQFVVASLGALFRKPSIAGRLLRARRREEQHASDSRPTLLSFAVDPSVQGMGIGARLLESYELELMRRGFNAYKLTTDASGNEGTQRFYEGHGIIPESTWTTPEGRSMLTMGKVLQP